MDFHDRNVRNLTCTSIECDELWTFIYAKDKNLPDSLKGMPEFGDMWVYVAMCPVTKLVVNWLAGKRVPSDAAFFAEDLASRIPGRVQITTDQLMLYRPAFENAFGDRCDYATIRKTMGESNKSPDGKFTQPQLGEERQASVFGSPDMAKVRTNSIERKHLTLRTWSKRFNRSTIAFAKRIEGLDAALAMHFTYYNYCHQHRTLKGSTPALEAGVTKQLWCVEDIVNLVAPPVAKKRGNYKKPRRDTRL